MDIGEIVAAIIIMPVAIYVAFIMINSFIEMTPEFASTGWKIFGAIVTGAASFLGYYLYRNYKNPRIPY